MDLPSVAERAEQKERPYISTGHLPEPETVQKLVTDAHQRFKSNTDGENSQVYPALARVPRDLFGVCVVGTTGRRSALRGIVCGRRRGFPREFAPQRHLRAHPIPLASK
jgi:hypothetical protein